ncbi:MAG: glutamate synthase [Oscillospiraceae bacterium]
MMTIEAKGMHFQELCHTIKSSGDGPVKVINCNGQRFLAGGMVSANLTIEGTPGNALGAYLDTGTITVHGNAQEATGDSMNGGEIVIYGSAGDGTGYAMRGGRILVRDNTGYRAGIHMKEYGEHRPVLVIGGRAGHFLGEYQAGGRIIVLNLQGSSSPVGDFCGTGMHGGEIFIRYDKPPAGLPKQVDSHRATQEEKCSIYGDVQHYCQLFDKNVDAIFRGDFYVLRPSQANPYRQMYTYN